MPLVLACLAEAAFVAGLEGPAARADSAAVGPKDLLHQTCSAEAAAAGTAAGPVAGGSAAEAAAVVAAVVAAAVAAGSKRETPETAD